MNEEYITFYLDKYFESIRAHSQKVFAKLTQNLKPVFCLLLLIEKVIHLLVRLCHVC